MMRIQRLYREYYNINSILSDTRLKIYWFLALLRILLNFIPQNGYIHPDEYFQSIEIVAGDYFDIDVYKPWEYNVTFPVRSVVFPQLTVGISYIIFKVIASCLLYLFGISLRNPYYLLLFPRLFMCALSFLSDYCLYKICLIWNQEYKTKLVIYSSSCIMMCYVTRTLSNSIELVLTSLLLYYVASCMDFSNKVIAESDRLLDSYRAAKTGTERANYYKLRASLPPHSLNNCLSLATITVAGIFNRPTFIAFAFPAIFFWLHRGLGTSNISLIDFHIRIFNFILCGIPVTIIFIIIDSFYFGYLTSGEILELEISMNNFVVTPLNFIKYNAVTKNLENHGLHPRYLHFLLNIPLLFNVLGVLGLIQIVKMTYSALRARWLELPRMNSITGLTMATFVIPILVLSIFPHQEPRFIIPLLMPLVLLSTCQLTNSSTNIISVVRVENETFRRGGSGRKKNEICKLEMCWYICNIILIIFYGFVHQAGVLQLTSHLASELKVKPHLTNIHLFTSYTYPIPTALLHLRNTKRTYISRGKHRYKLIKDFYAHEMGSTDLNLVREKILSTHSQCEETFQKKKLSSRVYYALPIYAYNVFTELSATNVNYTLNFKLVKSFYPHVSTEKLPLLPAMNSCLNLQKMIECLYQFFFQFQLLLLKVDN